MSAKKLLRDALGPSELTAGAVAGGYALAAGIWILVSDRLLAAAPLDVGTLTRLQTLKGWLFVATTALLLFVFIRRALERTRLTAEHLSASEEKFRTLVERSLAGIYIIQDGRFAYVNPRFGEIFGYPPEEITGRLSVDDLVAPGDRGKVGENIRRRLAGEVQHLKYEFCGMRADGAAIDVEVAGMTTTLGRRPAVIGTLLDQTERNNLQKQALEAQKLETLGLLAGGIVHDFGNVVSAITGRAEILALDLPPGSPARRDAEEILHSAQHASILIRQLLTFSRREKLESVSLDLNSAVRDCAAMLRSAAGGAVRLDLILEDGIGFVRMAPGQLEQALMNLVINARDAMPDGGVVTVSTRRGRLDAPAAPGKPCAVLAVRDTGAGMDRATLGRVFEIFFTTKPPGKGTGLGLPTVQRIAENAGGRVEIDSLPGAGTSVSVLLPLDESSRAPSA
ncbi:MAG: PAS domain S-box protein [Elusimicrobia bacterium]|nr:PAS domain S-box protein [Elusimicrobiota bacterium]